MAKKSMVARDVKRKKMMEKYLNRRNELRSASLNPKLSLEERMAARRELFTLPKNSSPTRMRNRCSITGRPRGYIRFFGLSRIAFREMALNGELPGIRKGSL
jgi:small subunit ribosomal protein S14